MADRTLLPPGARELHISQGHRQIYVGYVDRGGQVMLRNRSDNLHYPAQLQADTEFAHGLVILEAMHTGRDPEEAVAEYDALTARAA